VYSVGVLLWEMYHGRRAWAGLTQLQVGGSVHFSVIAVQAVDGLRLTLACVAQHDRLESPSGVLLADVDALISMSCWAGKG
jgi:hypothetical protein